MFGVPSRVGGARHLTPNPACVSRSDYADMAPGHSRGVNRCGHDHLACKFSINVTAPGGGSVLPALFARPIRVRQYGRALRVKVNR